MNKSRIIFFGFIFLCISGVAGIYYISWQTSKIPFISTTGFYFSGIDANDPDLISVWAEYKSSSEKKYIHCFQQYRSADDYIYDYWRKDMIFFFKSDRIFVEMPDSIWNKLENIWFKTGNKVSKYDKIQLQQNWIFENNGNTVKFSSGPNQVTQNTLKEGFENFVNSATFLKIPNKLLVYFYFVFLSVGICYFLRKRIKSIFIFLKARITTSIEKHRLFYARLFSILAGLITVFLIIEITLRILGYFHEKQNIDKNYALAQNADKLIICLGDSFTEGVGASRGKDYPAVLDRLVKAEFGDDYQVINLGQSGKNTTQIKDEFILYLNENTPEVVVIMAGSANYWNYYGFEDRNQFIYNIRTFKLIKLLWNEMFSVKSESTPIEMSDVFSEADYQQNREDFQEKLSSNNPSPTLDTSSFLNDREIIYYSILSKNSQDLCKEFRDSLSTEDEELMKIHDLLNGYQISSKDLSSGYYKAVYYFLQSRKCGSFFGEMFLNMSIREFPYIEDVYYNLLKIKCRVPLLPQDFDTKRVCINDTIAYYNLKFGFSTAQENIGQVFIEESTDLEIENGKINRWVEEDLEDVIVACQKKGIKLIIMSYPYKYENPVYAPVNSVLEGLAQKYKIIFVDNYSNFSNLTSQRNSYFVADGHCSDIGYEFIAKEVFSVIKSEKLINKSEIK